MLSKDENEESATDLSFSISRGGKGGGHDAGEDDVHVVMDRLPPSNWRIVTVQSPPERSPSQREGTMSEEAFNRQDQRDEGRTSGRGFGVLALEFSDVTTFNHGGEAVVTPIEAFSSEAMEYF